MYKILIQILTICTIFLITGCSIIENFIYHPDINQGNYFTIKDLSKIKLGMTKEQIIYILGTPMLKEPFGAQIWYYILYQKNSHQKAQQKTLILTFNEKSVLIKMYQKNNKRKKIVT
ncbi:outer membrane protein assembly factor BamE [Arsenophonus symbiont of Ornithomya chloropus]|uniref:outer membrane protein assembly factor BamE n=1 Tax=Arsenophonus symbiont of Ornithomya chloropus TaxID=634121 RepID=UPI0032B2D9BE